MNHLHGLNVHDPTQDLPPDEREILDEFRSAYEAKKPADAGNVPLTHHITSTALLPNCGWRPLDDNTLYRFLCADRDIGKLHPETSLKRLLNALQFRKDRHIDEILNILSTSTVGTRERLDSTDSALTSSTFTTRSQEDCLDITATSTVGVTGASLLAGSLGDDYKSVYVKRCIKVAFEKPKQQESLPPPLPLIKKQDSFQSIATATTATSSSTSSSREAPVAALTDATISAPPASTITQEQLEKYQRLRVRVFVGSDKRGYPVLFERLGAFMGSGNVHLFTTEEWITLYIWHLERHLVQMRHAALAEGKPIEKFVFFGDLSGVLRSILTGQVWSVVPLLKALAKTVEDHYPETVSNIVVFNVPKVATAVWEVIRQFMDPVTAAKVQLMPSFPKELALDLMNEDVLPIEYGGNNPIEYPKTARK